MDSANILSLLNYLGQGQQQPQTNVLQSVAPQQPMDPDNPAYSPPPQAPQASPVPQSPQSSLIPPQAVAQAADADAPPMPKPRRLSLLDTIGRISDVLAKVGGADPLYQPTLDARANQMQQVDMNKLDLATKQLALSTGQTAAANSERDRFANVLGAVSDAEDAGNMPQMMQAAGLTDPRYAPFVKMVQGNPETAKTLAAALGAGGDDAGKYSGNIVYAKDANGNLHAFQANQGSGDARDVLPAGMTPVDPLQFVNTGGAQVGVGKLSGAPKTILPIGVSPNTVANNATSRANNTATNATSRANNQANIDAKAAASGAKQGDPYTGYINGVNALRTLDASLGDLTNDPRLNGATGLVMGHGALTTDQRAIKAKIDSLVGQGIPAGIAAIKAAGGAAPRSVTEIMGEVKGLTGAIQNRDQATPDYIATVNAARQRLRQRINEFSDNALRQGFAVRDAKGNIGPAQQRSASSANSNLPTLGPADAAKLPSGTHFRTLDGRELVRQ